MNTTTDTTTELDTERAETLNTMARNYDRQAAHYRAWRDAELQRLREAGMTVTHMAEALSMSPKAIYLAIERANTPA